MAVLTPRSQPRVSVVGDTFASIGRIARNISAGLALSFPLAITWAQPAQAVLIFNFYESGSDLVIEGTGSLRLPSIGVGCPSVSGGLLRLDDGFLTGPSSSFCIYDVTGPTTLGAGIIPTNVPSSSDSGIALGLGYFRPQFGIDSTYVSGTSISSSSTFSGISLASLGLPDSGTLGTWTLVDPNDSSYIADTISVQVNASSTGGGGTSGGGGSSGGSGTSGGGGTPGSAENVPGPLPILGLAAAFGFSRKLRKRIQLHKGSNAVSTSPGA